MGYISYEAGLETIDVPARPGATESQSNIPDVNFVFVQRSIVFDHAASQIYVQSLVEDDRDWVISTARQIAQLVQHPQDVDSQEEDTALNETLACARIMKPSEAEYRAKVLACQQYLSSGDSYELCLTDETTITFPGPVNAWSLYKRLRRRNPAPFGAFLRLSDALVVGSSPERFLHWDRAGRCEFRPIKGTVKKSDTMTRKAAHAILNSSKERVENLMIVDLIRHDLCGVVGRKTAQCPSSWWSRNTRPFTSLSR
jgi:para-aminobenzoate synthetase